MPVNQAVSERLASVDTVLWDLDGTVTDSIVDICTSMNVVLAQYALPGVAVEDARLMVGLGAGKLLERAFNHVGGQEQYNAEAAYASFVSHYADNCCVETKLFPGVGNALESLYKRGFRQGICTNKPEQMARTIVSELGLADFFGSIIGGDSVAHRKPHAEPVLTCVSELQSEPGRTIMVGDSPADVGSAIAAEVPVAVVNWGYTEEPLESLGADLIVADIDELLSALPKAASGSEPADN